MLIWIIVNPHEMTPFAPRGLGIKKLMLLVGHNRGAGHHNGAGML